MTDVRLFQELIASEPIPVDIADHSDSESDGEEWMPEAVDANIGKYLFFLSLRAIIAK